MKKYKVTGMSCAACSSRVEKAVSSLDGVTSCSVNLLTGSMVVDGSVSADTVENAVKQAGYGISCVNSKSASTENTHTESKNVFSRLWVSLLLLAVLMYVSMGHNMWGWPLPEFIAPVNLGKSKVFYKRI